MAIQPDDPHNYNTISICYVNQDRLDLSIQMLEKACELKPNDFLFKSNLALHYRMAGNFDKSVSLLCEAIEARPDDPQLWCHLGATYAERHMLDKAKECLQKAIVIKPEFLPAHVDLAFTYHLMGDWKSGFAEYEWRFDYFNLLQFYKAAYDQTKKWNGKDSLKGKSILLYGEQGLGDIIQFIRYARLLKERGAHVIAHVPAELQSLVSKIDGVDEAIVCDIIVQKQSLPTYDCQCSLMSLPYLLGLDSIPKQKYIAAPNPIDVKTIYPDTFNIGISWAGSAAHPQDQVRSFHMKYFEGISKIPGVKLFNLQICPSKRVYGDGRTIIDFTEGGEVVQAVDAASTIRTFEDTANIIAGLDLVISVDTALVHLAGAMNVPCWVCIPYNPDWRWGIDGSTTDWYDSVKIFRQHRLRHWQPVFEKMEKELADLLQNK